MSDELYYYDKRIELVNVPYYAVGKLLSILGYEIHPPVDFKGGKIPANSPVYDDNRTKRSDYIEELTDKLIESIEQHRVVVKNVLELIVELPIKREQLVRARMYKSQIVLFCRSIGVKIVFKEPAELFVKKAVGDKEMLELVHSDINLISDDEDIQKEGMSEPRSPHSSSEVAQDIQIKSSVQEASVNCKELTSAVTVLPHECESHQYCTPLPKMSLEDNMSQEASVTQDRTEAVENTEKGVNASPPGKIPRTAIGQLAVKAAWEIELATGRKATARNVIKRLQEWAEKGEDDCLDSKINFGVVWITRPSGKQKKYETDTCGKALEIWNKSRR